MSQHETHGPNRVMVSHQVGPPGAYDGSVDKRLCLRCFAIPVSFDDTRLVLAIHFPLNLWS